ncbi:MAG: class I SAM-dependent methyltransferase [Acetobacteraceae bacterium]|nr:class I SAM-dependent methyltransferase [Acetobacteraceae bacterium]
MSLSSASLEEFEAALASLGDAAPDGEAYQRLAGMAVDHPLAARLKGLDPFTDAYRDGAMALYRDLSGRSGGYEPARDEQSGMGAPPPNPWTDLPPWSFRQPGLLAEFLLSWGRILRLLDLPAGGRVLEYGCGTGQLLLVLARAGLRAHGVDIDPASIAVARQQAEALGVPLGLELAPFGEGFAGERFDRIVFFEAFHHAWDFERLLARLHDRLAPGGRLVFCGEPIVSGPHPSVPFPWGPRLDALSVFCMRRWGWMELGFQHDVFLRLLRRNGWRAAFHPAPDCGRANAYVAEPAPATLLRLGEPHDLGEFADGWGPPEGTHRCTQKGTAVLPLPPDWAAEGGGNARIVLRVANPGAAAKRLVAAAGRASASVTLGPGEDGIIELADGGVAARLSLTSESQGAENTESGRLGVSVRDVERLEPTKPAGAAPDAGLLPLLKEVGRPFWRRLPEGARARIREHLPR